MSLPFVSVLLMGSTSTVATHWNMDPLPVMFSAVAVNDSTLVLTLALLASSVMSKISLLVISILSLFTQLMVGAVGVASAEQLSEI